MHQLCLIWKRCRVRLESLCLEYLVYYQYFFTPNQYLYKKHLFSCIPSLKRVLTKLTKVYHLSGNSDSARRIWNRVGILGVQSRRALHNAT